MLLSLLNSLGLVSPSSSYLCVSSCYRQRLQHQAAQQQTSLDSWCRRTSTHNTLWFCRLTKGGPGKALHIREYLVPVALSQRAAMFKTSVGVLLACIVLSVTQVSKSLSASRRLQGQFQASFKFWRITRISAVLSGSKRPQPLRVDQLQWNGSACSAVWSYHTDTPGPGLHRRLAGRCFGL